MKAFVMKAIGQVGFYDQSVSWWQFAYGTAPARAGDEARRSHAHDDPHLPV